MAAALAAATGVETPKPEPAGKAAKPAPDAPMPAAATAAATELAAVTESAKAEAARRYPALAVKDSLENEAFITAYREIKDSGDTDFFANPEWPLELAELLATRNGWTRGDQPAPAQSAPGIEPPGMEPPAEADAPAKAGSKMPQLPPPSDAEPPQVPGVR